MRANGTPVTTALALPQTPSLIDLGLTFKTPSFTKLPIADQIRISRESIEALHPGKSKLLESPLAVNWGQVPYSEGVGALWGDGPGDSGPRGDGYAELLRPEGPIVFAGEHLSYLGLWQEGSAVSAHEALKLVQSMAAEQAGKSASA